MKKNNKKNLIFLIAIVIVSGSISFNMKSNGENQKKIEEIPKPVKTQVAKHEFVYTKLDYIGIVSSKEYIKYSFEISGKIDEIFVQKGQFVEMGESLFEIDRSNLEYALESGTLKFNQSLIELEKAKENMNSIKDNFDKFI
jgi:multidrug efflux pump subunit AcrA (membrane-fusion protein)